MSTEDVKVKRHSKEHFEFTMADGHVYHSRICAKCKKWSFVIGLFGNEHLIEDVDGSWVHKPGSKICGK